MAADMAAFLLPAHLCVHPGEIPPRNFKSSRAHAPLRRYLPRPDTRNAGRPDFPD